MIYDNFIQLLYSSYKILLYIEYSIITGNVSPTVDLQAYIENAIRWKKYVYFK